MQDLRLVGMAEDGGAVILVDPDNSRFRLVIDDGLRSIVRRAGTPRLGSGPGSPGASVPPGSLRPRDIQARIRAGESADEVARLAGLPVERVRRYEGPILAERGHIAEAARRGTVRIPGDSSPGARHCVLDDEVSAALQRAGGDPAAAEWDAWRQDESRWTVRVRYWADHEEQQADFLYDALGRVSLAVDANARWLLGEQRPVQQQEEPVFVPRLAAVGAEPDVIDVRVASGGRMTVPADGSGLARRDEHPSAARTAEPASGERQEPAQEQPQEQAPAARPGSPSAPAAGRAGRAKGRAAVPAWDDILFGTKRQD